MKKTVCMLMTLVLMLGAVLVMNACGGSKEAEVKIPEGYTVYENGDISFAYPEDWTKTEGSTVTLVSESGNNITVVYEDKTDLYEKMTTDSFKSDLAPIFEAMGMTISGAKVEQTESNGLKVTKTTYDAEMSGMQMGQTLYNVTVGERTYTITVTEVTEDSELVETVLETLCEAE